jgi:hypothetical protein
LTGALQVTIGFTAPKQKINIQYALPNPTPGPVNMEGTTITSVVQFVSGFNAAYPIQGYIYVQDGQAMTWVSDYSGGTNAGPGCVVLSQTMPTSITTGFDPTQIYLIGVQFNSPSSGAVTTAVVDIFSWNY